MNKEEAIRILDAVIPPPEYHTVDLDHLPIAQAWLCIKEMLTANQIKHGKWLRTEAFPHHVFCSVCSKTYIPNDRWQTWTDGDLPRDYCPNCGARMERSEEWKTQ